MDDRHAVPTDAALTSRRHSNRTSLNSLNGGKTKKESGSHSLVRLRKELGLGPAVSVAMGVMIGCTIFLTPTSVSAHCGSVGLSLVVWAAAAAIMLLQAVCFTELAVTYPNAGGMYSYLLAVLGDLPAFLYAWYFCVVCQPAFMAFIAMMISSYLLKPLFPGCPLPTTALTIINVWIIVTLVYLNSSYLKVVRRTQTFLTAVKFVALVAIVIVGFIQIGKGQTEILREGFKGSTWDLGNVATAIYTCMTNYAGWEYLLMLTEEVKRPNKTIPRAIYISFAAVGTVFVLANVAYFTVLSPADMRATDTVAAAFAEKTMGPFALAVPIIVVLSSVGALNAVIMGGSRVHFAAARDKMFPAALAMISIKYCTPLPAVCMTCVLSSLWCLWGDPVSVIEYLGFTDVLFIGLTMSSLLYLKISQPDRKVSYKVPLALPILSMFILVSLAVIGLVRNPNRNGIGLIPIAIGFPVYGLIVATRGKDTHLNRGIDQTALFLQKLLLVIPEEKG